MGGSGVGTHSMRANLAALQIWHEGDKKGIRSAFVVLVAPAETACLSTAALCERDTCNVAGWWASWGDGHKWQGDRWTGTICSGLRNIMAVSSAVKYLNISGLHWLWPVNAHWDALRDLFSKLVQTIWRGPSGCICLCHDRQKFRPCLHSVIILIGGGLLDGVFVHLTEMWPDAVKGGCKGLLCVYSSFPWQCRAINTLNAAAGSILRKLHWFNAVSVLKQHYFYILSLLTPLFSSSLF